MTKKLKKELPDRLKVEKPKEKKSEDAELPEMTIPEEILEEEEKKTPEAEESSPGIGDEFEEELLEICGDLVSLPFEIWRLFQSEVESLTDSEKKFLAKYTSIVAVKYDLTRFIKAEIILLVRAGYIILKRIRAIRKKKHADNDRGEKRQGEDKPGEAADQGKQS